MYQTVKRDKISQLVQYFTEHPPRGEIILLISGDGCDDKQIDLESEIIELLSCGHSAKDTANILHSTIKYHTKSHIYHLANQIKKRELSR
jgi:16S rRNA C1402 (ribose-2'-O) methylase RsmI